MHSSAIVVKSKYSFARGPLYTITFYSWFLPPIISDGFSPIRMCHVNIHACKYTPITKFHIFLFITDYMTVAETVDIVAK